MNQPILKPRPEYGLYELTEDFKHIPKGFLFDGASIPKIFWAKIFSPFDPKVIASALEHDNDYSTHHRSRKHADKVFKKNLILNGVSKKKAQTMYLGVRVGGYFAYKKGSIVLK